MVLLRECRGDGVGVGPARRAGAVCNFARGPVHAAKSIGEGRDTVRRDARVGGGQLFGAPRGTLMRSSEREARDPSGFRVT